MSEYLFCTACQKAVLTEDFTQICDEENGVYSMTCTCGADGMSEDMTARWALNEILDASQVIHTEVPFNHQRWATRLEAAHDVLDEIVEAKLGLNRWRRVEDEPPAEREYTLCLAALWYDETKQYSIRFAQYDGYSKSFERFGPYNNCDYESRTTHWMLLPTPPEDE